MPPTLADLHRYALARSLFAPTTLPRAIAKLGFVQADPIRAPARAQDLVLRHRVRDYAAGDLERRYPRLAIEEDFFVNYGFLPRATQALLHPREPARTRGAGAPAATRAGARQARELLDFVRRHGVVHPAEVDAHFAHGRALNWFGGTSRASTQALDDLHHRGLLRVARREGGVRLYALREAGPAPADPQAAHDALIDVAVRLYAPLPAASLAQLVLLLRGGTPQWAAHRAAALARAKARLAHARVDGIDWYWPRGENPASRRHRDDEAVRLFAPFDPVVWDRRRFEIFWGWAYRFEAYTPAPKRRLGYYALPLSWRGQVIGWGNLDWRDGRLQSDLGYVSGRAPRDAAFRRGLEEELARIAAFLAAGSERR